jgi:lipoyl(octanoyl) transferase
MHLRILDLGRIAFAEAFTLQETLVATRRRNETPDTLVLAEHDPVYTLGRNADPANVLLPEASLSARGIGVVRTTRGGQVTYHGPGQIVGYPILKLSGAGRGVVQYVSRLEMTLIRVLAHFGVTGRTDPVNRGVWIGQEKVAALGIRVAGRVTMHGFSLNVDTAMEDYAGILPCGIRDRGVTSLHLHCPGITPDAVKPVVVHCFKSVFGYDADTTGSHPTNEPEGQSHDSEP